MQVPVPSTHVPRSRLWRRVLRTRLIGRSLSRPQGLFFVRSTRSTDAAARGGESTPSVPSGGPDNIWEHVFLFRLEEGQWRNRSPTDTPASPHTFTSTAPGRPSTSIPPSLAP